MEKIIHYCWFGGKPLPKLAKKCLKSWKKYLPDYKIMKWSEENVDLDECPFIRQAYDAKKYAFVADYVRTKALKEYGGIYFDTDMEVTKDISNLLKDNTFLGVEDTGYVAVGVWFESDKNAYLPTELLKKYQSFERFDIDIIQDISIPRLISEILEPFGLKKGYHELQRLDKGIVIYPRDYFYPYSFNRDNNVFSDNTCMIHYYDATWLPFKDRRNMWLTRKLGVDRAGKFLRRGSIIKLKILKALKIPLFPIVLYRHWKRDKALITEDYLKRLNDTLENIKSNKDKEYITIHNRDWIGVTSSTKELFENRVDVGEIQRKKDSKLIAKTIAENGIKQVLVSGYAKGYNDILIALHKYNRDIKIKTFWHGSNSQLLDKYDRELAFQILDLHKKKIVYAIGTCKESLLEFYKHQGFNAYFISNKVTIDKKLKAEIEAENKDLKNDKVRIGIYAAKCNNWRKNMYPQMAAIKFIDNAVIDMVPLNEDAVDFCKKNDIAIEGIDHAISREELLKRMSKNDVNLYVTLSECAPMLPLESMELGVPCINGNNHHYFDNLDIAKYVEVNNEIDIDEIKDKILLNIKEKDKIIELYNEFSKNNLELSKKQVEEFIKA